MSNQSKGAGKFINIYDVVPRPCVHFETDPDGKVTLLKPKFRNAFMIKYVLPRIRRKHYKIHLDDIGSATWKLCNGTNNAGLIAEKIRAEFGDTAEPVFDRVGKFLQQLQTAKMIELNNDQTN